MHFLGTSRQRSFLQQLLSTFDSHCLIPVYALCALGTTGRVFLVARVFQWKSGAGWNRRNPSLPSGLRQFVFRQTGRPDKKALNIDGFSGALLLSVRGIVISGPDTEPPS